jgi:hypothetical protein
MEIGVAGAAQEGRNTIARIRKIKRAKDVIRICL